MALFTWDVSRPKCLKTAANFDASRAAVAYLPSIAVIYAYRSFRRRLSAPASTA
jgi:hypothetical protein